MCPIADTSLDFHDRLILECYAKLLVICEEEDNDDLQHLINIISSKIIRGILMMSRKTTSNTVMSSLHRHARLMKLLLQHGVEEARDLQHFHNCIKLLIRAKDVELVNLISDHMFTLIAHKYYSADSIMPVFLQKSEYMSQLGSVPHLKEFFNMCVSLLSDDKLRICRDIVNEIRKEYNTEEAKAPEDRDVNRHQMNAQILENCEVLNEINPLYAIIRQQLIHTIKPGEMHRTISQLPLPKPLKLFLTSDVAPE